MFTKHITSTAPFHLPMQFHAVSSPQSCTTFSQDTMTIKVLSYTLGKLIGPWGESHWDGRGNPTACAPGKHTCTGRTWLALQICCSCREPESKKLILKKINPAIPTMFIKSSIRSNTHIQCSHWWLHFHWEWPPLSHLFFAITEHGSYKNFSKQSRTIQGLFKDISNTFQGLIPPSPESFCFLLSDKVDKESKKPVRPSTLVHFAWSTCIWGPSNTLSCITRPFSCIFQRIFW